MNGFTALVVQRARGDRGQLALWIVGTAALALLTHAGVTGTYGTQQDREALLATAIANPVVLLFRGLPSGAGEGAFVLFLVFPFLAMNAAFMSTFLAVRHTRGDEEDGRAELVSATPAGRRLPLLATAAYGLFANLTLGVLTTTALVSSGLPLQGSAVGGLGAGAVGVTFLGIGLACAQLFRSARGANAAAVWVLLATFLLAGIGNGAGTPSAALQRMESSWLVWLSPFGWGEQSRPFADDAVGPLLLCVAVGLALSGIALALQSVRDLGAGVFGERRGPAEAGLTLRSPIGLVWRLTRGAIAGWAIGGLCTGMLATALASVLRDVTTQLPSVEAVLTAITAQGSLEQGAVVIFFTMAGILAACCAVQVVCHARQEEARGTAEPVLARAVPRVGWIAGYLAVGFVAIVLVLATTVAGAALGLAGRGGDATLLGDAVVVAAGQVVAASVFLVLTAAVFVLAPRRTIPFGWTLVVLGTVLGLFGPLFGFPDAVVHLSPFASAPTVSGTGVDVRTLWWLVAAVVILGGGALALMRRRELAGDG